VFTIPPHGTAAFTVSFHPPDSAREFKEEFDVYVDAPVEPIHLTVSGRTR